MRVCRTTERKQDPTHPGGHQRGRGIWRELQASAESVQVKVQQPETDLWTKYGSMGELKVKRVTEQEEHRETSG